MSFSGARPEGLTVDEDLLELGGDNNEARTLMVHEGDLLEGIDRLVADHEPEHLELDAWEHVAIPVQRHDLYSDKFLIR
jgi:hypothetical protein